MATTKLYGPTDSVEDDLPPEGFERISLVQFDDGECYYQVLSHNDNFYLCDADGDRLDLPNSWMLLRVLADVPSGDSDAFFEAIESTAKRVETDV